MIRVSHFNVAYPAEDVSDSLTPKEPSHVFSEAVNLFVEHGEFFGLCGGNGAGKSTLLKALANLFPVYEGEIVIDGCTMKDPANSEVLRRKTGYMFQNPDNQIITTSVEDEILFGLENINCTREEMEARLSEALILTGLLSKQKTDPAMLSEGEKQKLVFAAILAMEPEILLLDEPTSMLDPAGAKRFLELLLEIRKQNKTILIASHRMEELMFCDRIAYLEKGAMRVFDSPGSFFASVDEESIEITPWISYLMKRFGNAFKKQDAVWGCPKEIFRTYDCV
jgi:energy-coupling factor transporter ATP-binding protein EcfA2